MNGHYHAIVWIDHSEARVFHFGAEDADRELIRTHKHDLHLHHKANSRGGGSGHALLDKEFLGRVMKSLETAGAILIVGPANAKTELAAYIKEHEPLLAGRISAVEPLDHPSDGSLVALARKFFRADDRMR